MDTERKASPSVLTRVKRYERLWKTNFISTYLAEALADVAFASVGLVRIVRTSCARWFPSMRFVFTASKFDRLMGTHNNDCYGVVAICKISYHRRFLVVGFLGWACFRHVVSTQGFPNTSDPRRAYFRKCLIITKQRIKSYVCILVFDFKTNNYPIIRVGCLTHLVWTVANNPHT